MYIYARSFVNINWAPYQVFRDWASSLGVIAAVSDWDIVQGADGGWELKVNGGVVGSFQSPSVALGALWGYHGQAGGDEDPAAFEVAVGAPLTWASNMGTVNATDPDTAGQTLTVSTSNWDANLAFPGATNLVMTLESWSASTRSWTILATSSPETPLLYTILADDVGRPKRVRIRSTTDNFMPLSWLPSGSPVVPDPLSIDRTPFYISYFAAQSTETARWGVGAGDEYTKTPVTDDVMTDPNTNGRLKFINDKVIDRALANGRVFKRVMIGNPAGFCAGNTTGSTELNQGYFPFNAGTALSATQAERFDTMQVNPSIGTDKTTGLIETLPTPFTTGGISAGVISGVQGNAKQAWSAAIDAIKATGTSEVFAYIGYGQCYNSPSKLAIDAQSLAYCPAWQRSEKEPSVYPAAAFAAEWAELSAAGFDNVSFDAGTRVAKYNAELDYTLGDDRLTTIATTVGNANQIFELIPRDSDGTPKDGGTYDYTRTKYWGLYPVSSGVQVNGVETGGQNLTNNSKLNLTTWSLDPTTTECHIAIDLFKLINENWYDMAGTPRQFTLQEAKDLVDTLIAKGFVVSALSWSTNSFSGGGTAGDFLDYLLQVQAVVEPGIGLVNPQAMEWDATYGDSPWAKFPSIKSNPSSYLSADWIFLNFSNQMGASAIDETVNGTFYGAYDGRSWSTRYNDDFAGMSDAQYDTDMTELESRILTWLSGRKAWLVANVADPSDWMINIDMESTVLDHLPREVSRWAELKAWWDINGTKAPFFDDLATAEYTTDLMHTSFTVNATTGEVGPLTFTQKGLHTLDLIHNVLDATKSEFGTLNVSWYNWPFRFGRDGNAKIWGDGTNFTEGEWVTYAEKRGELIGGLSYLSNFFQHAGWGATVYYSGYRDKTAPYPQLVHPRFYEAILKHTKAGIATAGTVPTYKCAMWTSIQAPVYDGPIFESDCDNPYAAFGDAGYYDFPVDPTSPKVTADLGTPSTYGYPLFNEAVVKFLGDLALETNSYIFGWIDAKLMGSFYSSNTATNDSRVELLDSIVNVVDWEMSKYKSRKPIIPYVGIKDGPAHTLIQDIYWNGPGRILGGSDVFAYPQQYAFEPTGNEVTWTASLNGNGRWFEANNTGVIIGSFLDANGTYPRLKEYFGGCLVDVKFVSATERTAWLAQLNADEFTGIRLTDNEGRVFVSRPIKELSAFATQEGDTVYAPINASSTILTFYLYPELAETNSGFHQTDTPNNVGNQLTPAWTAGDKFKVEIGTLRPLLTSNRKPWLWCPYAANPGPTPVDLSVDPSSWTNAQATSVNTILNWGMGSGSTTMPLYTKTPIDNSGGEMESSATNGMLKYYENNILNNFTAQEKSLFSRIAIVNPGGFLNYKSSTPHFSPTSGASLTNQSEIPLYKIDDTLETTDFNNTDGATFGITTSGMIPSPFTVGGRAHNGAPIGAKGDREATFKYAHKVVREQYKAAGYNGRVEFQSYTGYKVPYTDLGLTEYDLDLSAFNPWLTSNPSGWKRIRIEGGYGDFRKNEWNKAHHNMGFDVMGYDTGGKSSIEGSYPLQDDKATDWTLSSAAFGYRIMDEFKRGTPVPMMEAVYRDNGQQIVTDPEFKSYLAQPYLALYGPVINVIDEETGFKWGNQTSFVANNWLLDPDTTEVHCTFRWGDLCPLTAAKDPINSSEYHYIPDELDATDNSLFTANLYQRLMWTVFHRGFIVGLNWATYPPDMRLTNGGTSTDTVNDFQEFVYNLNQLDPLRNNESNPLNPYPAGNCSYPLHDAVQAYPQLGSLYGTQTGWKQGIVLSGYMYLSPGNLTLTDAAAKTIGEITTQLEASTTVPLYDKYTNPVSPYNNDLRTTQNMIADGPGEKVLMWDVEEPTGFVTSFTKDILDEYVLQGGSLTSNTTLADVLAEPTCADIWTKTKTTIARRIMVHKDVFPDYKMAVYGLPTFNPNGNENPSDTNYGPQTLRYEMYMDVLNYTDATDTNNQKLVSYIDILVPKYYPLGTASANNCLVPRATSTGNRYTVGIQLIFEHLIPQMLADLGSDGDHLEVQLLTSTAEGGNTTSDWPSENGLLRPTGHLTAFDVPGFLQTLLQKQAEFSWKQAGMDTSRLRRLGVWLNQAILGTTSNATIYTQDAIDIINAQFNQAADVWDQMILRSGDPDWKDTPIQSGPNDTFNEPTPVWNGSNTWFTSLNSGTWTSTGTANGQYILIDSGSQVDNGRLRVEAGSADIQIGDYCDVSLNGGDVKRCTYNGNNAGNGDFFFEWNDGTFLDSDIEPGGTFGWAAANLVIEFYRP